MVRRWAGKSDCRPVFDVPATCVADPPVAHEDDPWVWYQSGTGAHQAPAREEPRPRGRRPVGEEPAADRPRSQSHSYYRQTLADRATSTRQRPYQRRAPALGHAREQMAKTYKVLVPEAGKEDMDIERALQHIYREGRVPHLRLSQPWAGNPANGLVWLEEAAYAVSIPQHNSQTMAGTRPRHYPEVGFPASCGGGNEETRYRILGHIKPMYVRNQGLRPILYLGRGPVYGHNWALLASVVAACEYERKSSLVWWTICEDAERRDSVQHRQQTSRWLDYQQLLGVDVFAPWRGKLGQGPRRVEAAPRKSQLGRRQLVREGPARMHKRCSILLKATLGPLCL